MATQPPLTSRHLLGSGEDERAAQEEVEVEHVGHLIRSHQGIGSATPASSGHTAWQGKRRIGNHTQPAQPGPTQARDSLVSQDTWH